MSLDPLIFGLLEGDCRTIGSSVPELEESISKGLLDVLFVFLCFGDLSKVARW